MKPVIESLINAFIEEDCGDDQLYKVLADGIYIAVVKERIIPLGSPFPTYKRLAEITHMKMSRVQQLVKLLKERGIVETNGSGGSKIVSSLPLNPGLVTLRRTLEEANKPRIILNKDSFVDSINRPVGYARALETERASLRKLDLISIDPGDIPGLMEGCAGMMCDSSGVSFYKQQVTLVRDRDLLIYAICRSQMTKYGIWVMTYGSLKEKKNRIRDIKKNVEMVLSDDFGIMPEDLEKICKRSGKVEVVYFDLTSPVRPNYFAAPERLNKILELQRSYNFKIIIEYNYPDEGLSNQFAKQHFNCSKEFVLLIRPLSIYHQELKNYFMVAASSKIIRAIDRELTAVGRSISADLGYAAFSWIANGQLEKREQKIRETMCLARKEIAKELKFSKQWKMKHLDLKSGNSFYLEPVKGLLPTDIFQRLAAQNMDIIDSSLYDLPPRFKKGILIGYGKYNHIREKLNDIRALNEYAQKMIIDSGD